MKRKNNADMSEALSLLSPSQLIANDRKAIDSLKSVAQRLSDNGKTTDEVWKELFKTLGMMTAVNQNDPMLCVGKLISLISTLVNDGVQRGEKSTSA